MTAINPGLHALILRLIAKNPPAHPLPGTGPYSPPYVVNPGETDPAGGLDVNHPGGTAHPGGYIDTIGLLGGLYPGGMGIQNHAALTAAVAHLQRLLIGMKPAPAMRRPKA